MGVLWFLVLFTGFTIILFGTRGAYIYLSERSIHKILFVTVLVCGPVIIWYWMVLADFIRNGNQDVYLGTDGVLNLSATEDPVLAAIVRKWTILKAAPQPFGSEEIDFSKSAFPKLRETMNTIKREDFAIILSTDYQLNKTSNLANFRYALNKSIAMSTWENIMMTEKNTRLGNEDMINKDTVNLQENELTQNVFNYLPKKSLLPPAPYNVCSVVGNGGILNGSKCGKQIDNADMVLRFNLAPTSGEFEKDVGRKTNLTTTSFTALLVEYGNIKVLSFEKFFHRLENENGLVWYPSFFKGKMSKAALRAFLRMKERDNYHRIVLSGFNHFKAVEHFWLPLGFQRKLTTGLYFLTSAIVLCNEINAYGFWPFGRSPDGGRELRMNYYDNSSLYQDSKDYDLLKEIQAIAALHKQGVIKVHIDDCNDVL
ncbi:alpha-N-acetylneuraminide alpha-2,8-sialyltransferase-like [Amphiura filiformis]|uniref:alpha-N-acetylneuraminide alpha-2,8-sialyltransferase-like n=1 Tax=Amphiura filiformis TaxID=82378 RepID=UPI003B21E82D